MHYGFFQNFKGKFFEKKFLVILHGRKTNYTFVRYYMKCLYAILEVPKNFHRLDKSVFFDVLIFKLSPYAL